MEEGTATNTETVEAVEEASTEEATQPETKVEDTKVEEEVEKTEEKTEIDWKEKSRKWENQSKENLANLKTTQAELESIKAEHEKATSELAAAKEEAETARVELARFQAAIKHGVPESALKFLTGSTAEEIETSAKELVEAFGSTHKPHGVVRTQGNDSGSAPVSPEQMLAEWAQRNL